MITDWTQIITVGITSLTTIITGIIGLVARNKVKNSKFKKEPHQFIFSKIVDIYDIVTNVRQETKAKRVMIVAIHNGGSIPKIGSTYKATVLFESFEDPLKAIRQDWQQRQIDEEFLQVLGHISKDGVANLFVSKIKDDMSKYKDVMESYDTKRSIYFKLYDKESQFIILIANCTDEIEFTKKEIASLNTAVYKLNKIFEENGNLIYRYGG